MSYGASILTRAALSLAAVLVLAGAAEAQWTPLDRGSDNMEVLGHLLLGPHLNVSDMDVEQELSRPYAYVSRMVWGEGGGEGDGHHQHRGPRASRAHLASGGSRTRTSTPAPAGWT